MLRRHALIVLWFAMNVGCAEKNAHQRRGINTQGRSCYACHQLEYERSAAHFNQSTGMQLRPTTCEGCHNENEWRAGGVNSDALDGFVHPWPLLGAHASAPCARCHGSPPNEKYQGTSRECAVCHEDDRARAEQKPVVFPNHSNPGVCSMCHNTAAWK